MSDLIEILSKFNRKERFFLIGQALGKQKFVLADSFREDLFAKIGVEVPDCAYAAMDYHLDWIAASLRAHRNPDPTDELYSNSDNVVTGTQQDIDLLIAFKAGEVYHLVLVEAKGYSYWDNKQLLEKTQRLQNLFGHEGNEHHPEVKPHFCLMSPQKPEKLKCDSWPAWMRDYHWLQLKLENPRWKVTRCDSEGESSANGGHFRIKEDS